ncbi:C40 family peptidase, partial [Xanthovirga aplysinae]|uniref:C40 family peptidase n=1 Tax=Xanthovirga aplysinae TaxID=2529853 RepID=UPI0016574CFF
LLCSIKSCTFHVYTSDKDLKGIQAQSLEEAENDEGEQMLVEEGVLGETLPEVPDAYPGGRGPQPSAIQMKYAEILGLHPEDLKNEKLYFFIETWLGVPYKYGGIDKSGIDCSALVQTLFYEVYDREIPRTSLEMFQSELFDRFTGKKYLREGDLVFFRMSPDDVVSHVGIYLQNGKFLNAATSTGVEIADLNSIYYITRYYSSGRIKPLPVVN